MNFAVVFGASLWSGYALPACHPENGNPRRQPAEVPLIKRENLSRQSQPPLSAAGSGTKCGADASVLGRNAGPAFRPPLRPRQLRSIDGAMPSSVAICVNGRPLPARSATASRLNSSVN